MRHTAETVVFRPDLEAAVPPERTVNNRPSTKRTTTPVAATALRT
jgi:hypothetical protein